MMELSGRVVALTGAGSGIGRALAVELAQAGASLALSDVDAEGLRRTAELVCAGPNPPPRVTARVVDVRDQSAMAAWALAVAAEHGGVDVLINNAGTSCVVRVGEATYDDFALVLGVNLWGVLHGVKEFLPLLRQRQQAHIVNVASINAVVPFPSNGPYNISKFGVDALSRTLMMELAGTGITVGCVYPGGVRTSIARNSRYVSDADAEAFERQAKTSPEAAARRIVRGIRRRRSRIVIGADARAMDLLGRLAPVTTLRLIGAIWRRMTANRPSR